MRLPHPLTAYPELIVNFCPTGMMEDNIYYDFGRAELATNIGLVDRIARLAGTFGRPLASSVRTRAMLGLGPSAARLDQPVLAEVAG